MDCEWYHFLIAMFMLLFSFVSIIVGLFAVYFSGGKSRIISIIFVLLGIFVLFLFLWFSWCFPTIILGPPPIGLCGCITKGFSAFIGGILGILFSLGLLLAIFLKL
jgi:hypothetical protein